MEYNRYKDADAAAISSRDDVYRGHIGSAPRVTAKMRAAAPGIYGGHLLGAREFHDTAAQKSAKSAELLREVASLRRTHGHDFIGHDGFKEVKGNQNRIAVLEKLAEKMDARAKAHKDAFHNFVSCVLPQDI
ncbi:hypothetical protein AJ79_05845 [Helicocarpus griseus UAMH5409]|uniref:Uncharacterized protein n=1 Tax=Helicocarpus griseus UAMH5409 TaxID=1447875 RepID=A0A2B7XJ78_9EURO|nr:hypothetical protein AJ79_05845 [Helicocarpus griseus UAMH5409]